MMERRKAPRQKSLLRGCIYFNNRRSAVDCLIRDISSDGARLVFSDATAVPDIVDLYIPQKEQTLRSRVKWRHGQEAGVSFEQVAAAASSDPPKETSKLARRVAQLEVEIAALKCILKKMQADGGGSEVA
jgi:hypothetical protein